EITKEDMILKVINTIARDEIAIGEITEDEIKSIVFKYLPEMEKDLDKLNMKFQEFQAKIEKEQ
ncbi:MAG: hypothetical protein PUP46_02330, partial [Endozoicomonas sp. (ex Botrylloides leachii)]|nr:hypothetical protein [Endozoicomonas sp. (ex Botrylloides leachii)]